MKVFFTKRIAVFALLGIFSAAFSFAQQITKFAVVDTAKVYQAYFRNSAPVRNYENKKDLEDILEKELKNIYKYMNIKDNDNCLIIGLGNEKSTPDSLGPKVLNRIMVTRHLFLLANSEVSEGVRNVSIFTPNVMGNTGIESADIINNVVKSTNPKFLIAIDALASNSISRINRTIQITDSGIHPGSGIGNNRKEISKKTIVIDHF